MAAFTFGYATYRDDDGNDYSIRMRNDVATALGVSTSALPAHDIWPHARKRLRHIRGKNSTGQRCFAIMTSPATTLYTSPIGTSFSWTAQLGTCVLMSKEGESIRISR